MGILVSESDYQDILGDSQEKEYERVECISNIKPFLINTKIFTTEATKFEIRLALKERNPELIMGSCDFTMKRKTALFQASHNSLMYVFPQDTGEKHGCCAWSLSKPVGYDTVLPHVIEFGNNYIKDNTSDRKGELAPEDHFFLDSGEGDPRVKSFSTNAPFGLFGVVEYKGEGLPLSYIIPQSDVYSIYHFKVFENKQLIANMVPVKDGADILCMYDLVRNDFFYPLDAKGQVVNLLKRDVEITEGKHKKEGEGTIRRIVQSFKYAIKREWNPKYHGGKLEIIKRGDKVKIIAHSTTDNDTIVVWNSDSRDVEKASWRSSGILIYCGLGQWLMLYGPNNYDDNILNFGGDIY